MTCIGFALGFAYLTCTMHPQPAPSGRAPFCEVVRQAGGALRPSRKDTPESARYMNRLAAAYNATCKGN
jgi:hypothetical protein